MPPQPMLVPVDGAHEVVGIGIVAPDQKGKPVLHMHAAMGRSGNTVSGCLRPGVETWVVGEVILYEILEAKATRIRDKSTGFTLLEPGDWKPVLSQRQKRNQITDISKT
jgi:predicted DNA-binding protein with PD1-like motif